MNRPSIVSLFIIILPCSVLFVGAAELPSARALAQVLEKGDASDRIAASRKLSALGAELKDMAPTLAKGLGDEYFEVRRNCCTALAALGKDAVPHVRKLVADGSYHERTNALRVLGKLGSEAREALPEVQKALTHRDWQTRAEAMDALGRMGAAEYLEAFDALTKALDDPYLPGGAALLIRQIHAGTPAARKKMEPAMRRLLKSEKPAHILLALQMFQKMGIDLSNDDMAAAMDRVKAHDPEWLIEIAKREKAGAVWAVPALAEMLDAGGDEWHVARICDALFLIGPASERAVPALTKSLDHRGPGAQRYAARALGMLGGKSKKALPKLRGLQKETKDVQVRQWVSDAIKAIEGAE